MTCYTVTLLFHALLNMMVNNALDIYKMFTVKNKNCDPICGKYYFLGDMTNLKNSCHACLRAWTKQEGVVQYLVCYKQGTTLKYDEDV